MYFFIVFIIATFGLLYTYFKMSQKAEEDARRENIGTGLYEQKADFNKNQQALKAGFFDFLAGQMDEETSTGRNNSRTMNSNNKSFNSMIYREKPKSQGNRN